MYGQEQTRGIRHHVRREVIGEPLTEEELSRHFSADQIAEVKAISVFGGPVFGSKDIVVRWSEDADPLDVAACITAGLISEEPNAVAEVLRKAFGETKEVI